MKECIHQSMSLSESVLRVGCLSWPPQVSAAHVLQLQYATAADSLIQASQHQVSSTGSFAAQLVVFT